MRRRAGSPRKELQSTVQMLVQYKVNIKYTLKTDVKNVRISGKQTTVSSAASHILANKYDYNGSVH
jgi:uncharacterized protein YfdQ (DUF2303 family)